jgi:hypothetical protein
LLLPIYPEGEKTEVGGAGMNRFRRAHERMVDLAVLLNSPLEFTGIGSRLDLDWDALAQWLCKRNVARV